MSNKIEDRIRRLSVNTVDERLRKLSSGMDDVRYRKTSVGGNKMKVRKQSANRLQQLQSERERHKQVQAYRHADSSLIILNVCILDRWTSVIEKPWTIPSQEPMASPLPRRLIFLSTSYRFVVDFVRVLVDKKNLKHLSFQTGIPTPHYFGLKAQHSREQAYRAFFKFIELQFSFSSFSLLLCSGSFIICISIVNISSAVTLISLVIVLC